MNQERLSDENKWLSAALYGQLLDRMDALVNSHRAKNHPESKLQWGMGNLTKVNIYDGGKKLVPSSSFPYHQQWDICMRVVGDWQKRTKFQGAAPNEVDQRPQTKVAVNRYVFKARTAEDVRLRLRSIGRMYCFLCPTAEMLDLASELCQMPSSPDGRVDFVPGTVLVGHQHPDLPDEISFVELSIQQLLSLRQSSRAIQEYSRYGILESRCVHALLIDGKFDKALASVWPQITNGFLPTMLWLSVESLNPRLVVPFQKEATDIKGEKTMERSHRSKINDDLAKSKGKVAPSTANFPNYEKEYSWDDGIWTPETMVGKWLKEFHSRLYGRYVPKQFGDEEAVNLNMLCERMQAKDLVAFVFNAGSELQLTDVKRIGRSKHGVLFGKQISRRDYCSYHVATLSEQQALRFGQEMTRLYPPEVHPPVDPLELVMRFKDGDRLPEDRTADVNPAERFYSFPLDRFK